MLIKRASFQGMSGQKNISLDMAFLNYRHPSPVSVFEHFSFTESCNSSDSAESNRGTEGTTMHIVFCIGKLIKD